MADDHFIAQTYLRNFQKDRAKLRISRKSGFPNRGYYPKEICYEIDGDLVKSHLINPSQIGDFRKLFEPHWNLALNSLNARHVSPDVKLVVSNFMANLLATTPTSTRLNMSSYRHFVIENVRAHQSLSARRGKPDPKIERALEILDAGHLIIDIDIDWIRAQNAIRLLDFAWRLFHSSWTIISNITPIDFITSDNPFAFEDPGPFIGGKSTLPRFLPLSPQLYLHVEMDALTDVGNPDFAKPPRGTVNFATTDQVAGVEFINELVVACAEELAIASTKIPELDSLAAKYAKHRVRNEFLKIPHPDGFLLGMRLRVCDSDNIN